MGWVVGASITSLDGCTVSTPVEDVYIPQIPHAGCFFVLLGAAHGGKRTTPLLTSACMVVCNIPVMSYRTCFFKVGHVRAAEELRATLLYTPAPKNSLKTQELATTWRTPRDDQLTSIQTRGGQRLRERHGSGSGSGSSGTFSSPPPPASLTRQRAGSTASFAAASAMAAVRKGDRPFYLGAARLASRGGGASLKQVQQYEGAGVSWK